MTAADVDEGSVPLTAFVDEATLTELIESDTASGMVDVMQALPTGHALARKTKERTRKVGGQPVTPSPRMTRVDSPSPSPPRTLQFDIHNINSEYANATGSGTSIRVTGRVQVTPFLKSGWTSGMHSRCPRRGVHPCGRVCDCALCVPPPRLIAGTPHTTAQGMWSGWPSCPGAGTAPSSPPPSCPTSSPR